MPTRRQSRLDSPRAGGSRQRTSRAHVRYAESPSQEPEPSSADSEGSEGLATIRLTQRSSPAKQTLSQRRNKRVYALSSDDDEDMDAVDDQVPVASSSGPITGPIILDEESSDEEPRRNKRPNHGKTRPVIELDSRRHPKLPPFYSIPDSPPRTKRATTLSAINPSSRPIPTAHPSAKHSRLIPVIELTRFSPAQLATYSAFVSTKRVSFQAVPEKTSHRVVLSISPALDEPRDESTVSRPKATSDNDTTLQPPTKKGKARASPRTYPPIPSRTPSPVTRAPVVLSESSDDEIIQRRTKPTKSKTHSKSRHKQKSPIPSKPKSSRKHSRHRDPDNDGAVTDEDDVDDLDLDEPERFKTKTRLRKKKETDFQRRLRKLKQLREGRVEDSTEESESEDEPAGIAPPDKDFIVEDDGELAEGLMPHEFSINSSQTPEFKFKVVFHWLLLLVMDEQSALHLRPEDREYFMPQVEDLRRKMQGYRESRVRSQIWRPRFTARLRKYPTFTAAFIGESEIGCDVCHISTKHSPYLGHFSGAPYDPKTHELIEVESSGSEPETFAQRDDKRYYLMGRHCKRRAEVYHRMVHWEHVLYNRIRDYYRDLLRAKNVAFSSDSELSSESGEEGDREERRRQRENRRYKTARRVKELKEMQLSKVDWKSVDKVLLWMDRDMEYQAKQFRWLEKIIEQSEALENDKSKDE